jgi:GR25 family glycosyltransferase involved in LPS biosynthesis
MGSEFQESMLQHVPALDLQFDGDCAQAAGVDLPIAVINLPRRTDRWQTLSRRMSAAGLDKLIKVPAVEGARLPKAQIAGLLGAPADPIDQAPQSHLSLTRPAIGCFLSHLAVWRWMIAQGIPRLLVLEDDAAPAPGYNAARLRGVLAELPDDAGLTLLGRIIMHGLAERPGGSSLARMYYFNGTFAYLITPAAARLLLQHLVPLRCHIDHQISSTLIEQRQRFAAYCVEPPLFDPDWSQRSDCYVPLADEPLADRELAQQFEAQRQMLLREGRPLLPLAQAG